MNINFTKFLLVTTSAFFLFHYPATAMDEYIEGPPFQPFSKTPDFNKPETLSDQQRLEREAVILLIQRPSTIATSRDRKTIERELSTYEAQAKMEDRPIFCYAKAVELRAELCIMDPITAAAIAEKRRALEEKRRKLQLPGG